MSLPQIEVRLSTQQEAQGISVLAFLGSVAAGKTTICTKLTGITTQRHTNELINGCTINMGYTHLKIYYNATTKTYLTNPKAEELTPGYTLLRHFSIADNPGHNSYMAAMISGINSVDNAIFLVSGTNGIEPQTYQHLKCFKTTGCTEMCVIISKVDLVSTKMKLVEIQTAIDDVFEKVFDDDADNYDPPIIPLSTQTGVNIDKLIKYLVASPYPKQLMSIVDKPPMMSVIRSFDNNKPGVMLERLIGATIGGSIQQGYFAVGDVITLYPGIVRKRNDMFICIPLTTQIIEMRSDETKLQVALPGGFVAFNTTLDPALSKSNGLVGQIVVSRRNDAMIKIINNVSVEIIETFNDNNNFIVNKCYLLTAHGSSNMAKLISHVDNQLTFEFINPVASMLGEKIAILSKNDATLELACCGRIVSHRADQNIVRIVQPDLERFLQNLPITQTIGSIKLINDLTSPPISIESLQDEINDFNNIAGQITFTRTRYTFTLPAIELKKTNVSVKIENARLIFSQFVKNKDTMAIYFRKYANQIIKYFDKQMRNAEVTFDDNKIVFSGLKYTSKRFFIVDFNRCLDEFIKEEFTCAVCKQIGSIYIDDTQEVCNACKAIRSVKK